MIANSNFHHLRDTIWLGHVSLNTTNIYAEIDLETKAKALAMCAVADESKPAKRWRDRPALMEFLRAL